jgi:hypothetical protein
MNQTNLIKGNILKDPIFPKFIRLKRESLLLVSLNFTFIATRSGKKFINKIKNQ